VPKKKLIKSMRKIVGNNGKKRSKKLNLSELRKSRETLVEKLDESFERLYDYTHNIKDSLPENVKGPLSLVEYTKLDRIHIFYVGEAKRFNKLPDICEKIDLGLYEGYRDFKKIFEEIFSERIRSEKKLINEENRCNNVTEIDESEYEGYFLKLEESRNEFDVLEEEFKASKKIHYGVLD